MYVCGMQIPSSMRCLKGFRFPRDIIAYAVWAYHRFTLSCADVEDLLADRGVIVSRETVRNWVTCFGSFFAACIKRDRPVLQTRGILMRWLSKSVAKLFGCGVRLMPTATHLIFWCKRDVTQRQRCVFSSACSPAMVILALSLLINYAVISNRSEHKHHRLITEPTKD